MRSRGLRPASETLDLAHRACRRASRTRFCTLSPSEPVLVAERLQACRRREHGDRDRAHPSLARARTHRTRPRGAFLLRAPARSLRHRRRRGRADDRAHGDRRGRVATHSACRSIRRRFASSASRTRTTGEIVEFVESIYRGDRYRLVDLAVDPAGATAGASTARRAAAVARAQSVVSTSANSSARVEATPLSRRFDAASVATVGLDRRPQMWKPPARGRLVQTTWVLQPRTATLIRTARSSARMPREMRMNVRIFAAAALVAALAVVAVGASGASGGGSANTLTVWLQVDAQSGWPEVVAAANAQFKAQNPGWNVDVQYQTWGTHLAKFDATLAGGNSPDVIEMGNTEMTKYMAAGAFQDLLRAVVVPEPEHLAGGPRRLRPLRRQALRRPVLRGIAGRHLPHRPVQAGQREDPDEPERVHRAGARSSAPRTARSRSRPSTSPGTDWYVAMSFVARLRRKDRDDAQGQVGRHARQAGRARRSCRVQALLRRLLSGRRRRPTRHIRSRTTSCAQGNAASTYGAGWFTCCVGDSTRARSRSS